MKKIFVYGTLMRGERANSMLDRGTYMGDYVLEDYATYDLGYYPGIKRMLGGRVIGELYEVPEDIIPRLDMYEGEGSLYKRVLVTVKNKEDCVDNVYVYVYLGNVAGERYRKWITARV